MGLLMVAAILIPFVFVNVSVALLPNQTAAGLLVFFASIAVILFLMLYLASRMMQFSYLIIDRGAGMMESIQLSWRLTRRRAGTIILVYCMHLILLIGGLLAFCVGVIFTLPLGSMMQVVTFLAMAGPNRPSGADADCDGTGERADRGSRSEGEPNVNPPASRYVIRSNFFTHRLGEFQQEFHGPRFMPVSGPDFDGGDSPSAAIRNVVGIPSERNTGGTLPFWVRRNVIPMSLPLRKRRTV